MWPIQLAFRLLISCRIFLCSLTLSNTSSFLTFLSRSNWYFPSFSRTTFQYFPAVSDLLPEASKFQHHIKLCSKCSTSLASSSIPSPMRCNETKFAASRKWNSCPPNHCEIHTVPVWTQFHQPLIHAGQLRQNWPTITRLLLGYSYNCIASCITIS